MRRLSRRGFFGLFAACYIRPQQWPVYFYDPVFLSRSQLETYWDGGQRKAYWDGGR